MILTLRRIIFALALRVIGTQRPRRHLSFGLIALPVLIVAVAVTSTVTFAAFSASTQNPGNTFQALNSFGLVQLPGTAGCTSEDGTGGLCANGNALLESAGITVSSDGTHAYVATYVADGVAAFARNTSTGALTQLVGITGCTTETGTGGTCVDGKALDASWDVAVSPDGAHVYVAAFNSDAVAIFSRNTLTGALTQLPATAGCVSETGTAGACVDGKALDGADGVAVSPDGAHVYVTSYNSDAVAIFSRNTITGALTQLAGTAGCVSETGTAGACVDGKALDGANPVEISPDGASVYAGADTSDAVAIFSRNTTTGALTQLAGTAGCVSETGTAGACVDGKALDATYDIALSPDGINLYVAASLSDAVAAFSRNTTTGAITQLAGTAGCVSETGTAGACVDGVALDGAQGVATSPDGQDVYVAAQAGDAVAVFRRDGSSGQLTQWAGTRACISETGTGGLCADGKALDGPHRIVVTPDGKDVYTGGGTPAIPFVAAFSRTR